MKIKFCACGWRINIWTFILDSSASAIWYFCHVSAIVLVFHLLFNFCNLVFAFSFCKFFWSDILSSVFAKSGISTFLQLLQFGIFVLSLQLFWYFIFSSVSVILFGVIFCLPFLQNLVFRLSFSFYNLVVLFCLCNCFGISSSLQFLQFGIWYFCSVSAIVLVFRLLFSFFNLVFAFSFLQLLLWHLLPKRLFGYIGYLLIWEFSFLILLLCIVTTRVLFRLLTTWFFISELSTLKSIVILLIIISSMAPLLCLLFLLPCRLHISLPRHISSLIFVF